MERIAIQVNQDLCTGCMSCVEACSLIHEDEVSYSRSRIKIAKDKIRAVFVPLLCEMCYGHCAFVCPEEAINFDTQLGTPIIDEEQCNGCMTCLKECPYEGIIYDKVNKKALKCDLCGGDPTCVKVCQPGALVAIKPNQNTLYEKYEKACLKMHVFKEQIEPGAKKYGKKKSARVEKGV